MTDAPLVAADFTAFFQALWGKDTTPFPWQSALAERVLEERPDPWPAAITLPTAAGKTACLDIALFALASQAERQARRLPLTAPRRIFFVVDRRVIVDEAFDRARTIARLLAQAREGVLHRVANRLRFLAGGDGHPPLHCCQLRGGIYRDDSWARSPIQPTIICSTVDQTGSRLLFRAYGRSFKAWHLQAGLVANDSLLLLDEAHCAQPFMETLGAVARYRDWAEQPLALPFHRVVMTATPPAGCPSFPDADIRAQDRTHPILRQRLDAQKPTRLRVADKAKGRDAQKAGQALAELMVAQARELTAGFRGQDQEADAKAPAYAPAIVIFCNRVDTARRAHAILEHTEPGCSVLLTGRMRPIDRDDTVAGPLAELSASLSHARCLQQPLYVVSTQTLEVGANLDFDLLVSECADLPALRQRFGRLNRMGRPVASQAVVVIRADQAEADSEPDPIYGRALKETWDWLQSRLDEAGEIDMGITALERRLPDDLAPLTTEAPHAPVMLPAHLDALCQTAPEPRPTPDISLFLHGAQNAAADVQLCWRADLDDSLSDDDWIEAVTACPPSAGELMPVPIGALRRWLAGETPGDDGGDLTTSVLDVEPASQERAARVLRWRGPDDSEVIGTPDQIRPGDLLVLPLGLQGTETLGHVPSGRPMDLGDRANWLLRGRPVLRLTPATLRDWLADRPGGAARDALLGGLATTPEQRSHADLEDPDTRADSLKAALEDIASDHTAPDWLREIAGVFAADRHLVRRIFAHPGGLLLRGQPRPGGKGQIVGDFSHEDDAAASGTVPVQLAAHLQGVREMAKALTRHVTPEIASDICLSAFAHDLGKADPRFQGVLYGGNPWARGPLLAKSDAMPKSRAAHRAACRAAGYPRGSRHELLSVRLLESAPELLARAVDPDLVLHLVASHHGHCRPFAPVVVDEAPQTVELEIDGTRFRASSNTGLEHLGSGVAERFWRLIRRYGWWGLAGLEAMLMLADHRRSEAEQQQGRGEQDA